MEANRELEVGERLHITIFFIDPSSQRAIEHEIRFNRNYNEEKIYQWIIIDSMKRLYTYLLKRLADNLPQLDLRFYRVPRPAPTVIVDSLVCQGFMLTQRKANGPYIAVEKN